MRAFYRLRAQFAGPGGLPRPAACASNRRYLHPDEAEALEKRAELKRVSKSEIIRRALRAYLGIED